MADGVYDEGRNGLLGGGVHAQPDLTTAAIGAGLRDEGVTAINLTTQIDVADVSSSWVTNGRDNAMPSPTVGSAAVGAFDHADNTFTAVSGATVESIDYFDFATATDATSPLLWNLDTWTGLPLTPNGGDVIIAPAAGGVFQILGA